MRAKRLYVKWLVYFALCVMMMMMMILVLYYNISVISASTTCGNFIVNWHLLASLHGGTSSSALTDVKDPGEANRLLPLPQHPSQLGQHVTFGSRIDATLKNKEERTRWSEPSFLLGTDANVTNAQT